MASIKETIFQNAVQLLVICEMASLNLSLRARRVSAHYFHESVASGNMSADFSGQCLLPQGQQRMLKDLIIHQFFKKLFALTA